MKQIQYEIVALQVDKMFNQTLALTDVEEINNNFDKIRNFIQSCGWSCESYTHRMMGWETLNVEN